MQAMFLSSLGAIAAASMTAPSTEFGAAATTSVRTPAVGSGFDAYKIYLMDQARRRQIPEDIIRASVPHLTLNEQAMRLDRAQRPVGSWSSTGSPPLTPYLRKHVTPSLIRRGQERYYTHWSDLVQLERRYGVDSATLVAIFGKETSYGSYTGSFDLLQVLATLGYEGRRRTLFEAEFIAALELLKAGVPRSRLIGSYAGATGYPQFMPSVVLRLRADGDGDGYADIWSNEADALASIANYLRDAGWKPDVPWGSAVRVPATLDRARIRPSDEAASCNAVRRHSRWLPVAEWRALGVLPLIGSLPETELAALLEPEGPGEDAYLLTANYLAILRYNCSNQYGLSVALLSDAIARRGQVRPSHS